LTGLAGRRYRAGTRTAQELIAVPPEHLDVLVVGAGLSGIGAGYHLWDTCPGKSYAILEARDSLGGTWDLFRYPGVRSDSDMHTLGYAFRPWPGRVAIADGPSILEYLRGTARAYGVDEKIRYGHRAVAAHWSTADARWTVEIERAGAGGGTEGIQITCGFLLCCTGYYRYDEGYTPRFEGRDNFAGPVVHPQAWPPDLDFAGKRVVVIGSGATAVTLVPSLAEKATHVTMLQRSPTYIVGRSQHDALAERIRRVLPARLAAPTVRWKNIVRQQFFYRLSRTMPAFVKLYLSRLLKRQLPAGYDIARHFTPRYQPWDQRMCLAPDGDLFAAIRRGTASVVTDHVERFTPGGVLLRSGKELPADVIVTATGLNMVLLGGVRLQVDGSPVRLPEHKTFKGMMLSDVPNFAFATGYTNASWTLKTDLTGEYVCRLLRYMDKHGYRQCVAHDDHPSADERPLLDLSAGYVQRSIGDLPRQGTAAPWRQHMSYAADLAALRFGSMTNRVMRFSTPAATPTAAGRGPDHEVG
jgi:cation diffusion facilitator CzcD-associated flavoprotein CzcO